jgi:AbrB family looped-hinge helix DNA binding protein
MVWYYGIMNARLSIDRAGRLVLPKPVREQLQIEAGESLEMESFEDHIILRPVRENATAYKKKGIWVFHTDAPVTASIVRDTIRRVRKDREQAILGVEK